VALVEIGGFAYVLGVSAQRVEKLDRLELDQIELRPEGPSRAEFSSDFKRQINERMGKWLGHGGQNDIKNTR
jgi:flagellar biogenesis protein FliO